MKRLPVQLAAADIPGRPKTTRRNEKLNLQLYQYINAPHTMQRIDITCFPDRHFWHEGYDKAIQAARAGGMAGLGVARLGDADLLRAQDATLVVASLDDVATDALARGHLARRPA